MSPVLIGIGTILAMATFIGIVWWAWSGRRAKDNDQAAHLPFDLPDEYPSDKNTGDKT